MRRVLVIGPGGSGKSTFSLALSKATGLPVIHLDSHFWRPGWKRVPAEEWPKMVSELMRGEAWIMDGNFGSTLDLRLQAADTVFFLNLPRRTCLFRVLRRRWRYRGRTRPSLPPDCPDRIPPEFLYWIWTYRTRRTPDILRRLEALGSSTTAHVFNVQAEADRFLRSLG